MLEQRGVHVDIISTRMPVRSKIVHDWAATRVAETTYLWPFEGVRELVQAAAVLLAAGPAKLSRCMKATLFARGLSAKERLTSAFLMLPAAKLARLTRERRLTHVHSHFAANSATTAMLAHLLTGVPYSVSAHGPLAHFGYNHENKWRYATFGIAITDLLRNELATDLGPVMPARFAVAPMGIEVEKYRRRTQYRAYDGKGPFRVFSCGRLNPCKGHHFLIRAAATLKEQGVPIHVRIAGVDDDANDTTKRSLEALIAELGLQSDVELLGGLSEGAVRDELESAHAFVLASYQEPLGVATMEAMAMSLPTIGTAAGGVPELIDTDVHGILVPPADPLALAAAIQRLAGNPALCHRLRRAGRARIEAKFYVARSADTLICLIRGLPADPIERPAVGDESLIRVIDPADVAATAEGEAETEAGADAASLARVS